MATTRAPVQQSALSPEFVPGKQFRIAHQNFQLTRVLHTPTIAFTAHFTTTQDGRVISERYAEVYQVPCLARKAGDPFDYFLEVYYWTDSGIERAKLKEKRKKLPGATEEPDGTAVLTLEKIASSKDVPMGRYNLIYIWQVEKSLDPKGPLLAYKQEFSEYLEKHLPPGCIITLAGGHKYKIESFLSAEGAFGTIFKASLLETNKSVVLKFQEVRAGVHEALALRDFYGHPGIVDFLQASEVIEYFNPREATASGNPLSGEIVFQQKQGQQKRVHFYCVVAEYVHGKNLTQFIRDSKGNLVTRLYDWFDNIPFWGKRGDKLIGLGDCVSYIEQLSDAVDFIHHRGYVHLDIKPQNVMLDGDNKLQIVDMGSVSKVGSGVFAFGQGNHAAPEVKEYLTNINRTTSRWMQQFVANIQSTWQVGTNIPESLLNSLRSGLTDEQKKLQQQCDTESRVAYQKISTQSDVFSVGAIFLSLFSGKNPRQVAMPDENAPTRVGRILMYEDELPLRRRLFSPAIRKAMSINAGERYQTCLGLKQAIQSAYTNLTYNEIFISGILLFAILALMLYSLLKLPGALAAGVFGISAIGFLGWRVFQFVRKPILSAIQLRPYSNVSVRLLVSALLMSLLFIIIEFGNFLYTERAFFIPGINQEVVRQVSPVYYQVSPPKSMAVDELVFETGYMAHQSDDNEKAKSQFQIFLRMHQDDFGLSLTQIDEFNQGTAQQLSKFVSENPDGNLTTEVIVVMVFIEPDRLLQIVNDTNLYNSPDTQASPAVLVPADTTLVVLENIQGNWYLIWDDEVLYYVQLEVMQ